MSPIRTAPYAPHFARGPFAATESPTPSPDVWRARLVVETKRRARRCTRALAALKCVERGRVIRADVASRQERARRRALDARLSYLRALDRLWQANASDEAMAIFREQRAAAR